MLLEKWEKRQLTGLLLLTIVLFSFFDFIPIKRMLIVKFFAMGMVAYMIFSSYSEVLFDNSNSFSRIVRVLLVSVLISMISSLAFWGQSLLLSFRISYQILAYAFFFYLIKKNVSIHVVERYIIFIAGIYVLLWLLAQFMNPLPLFGRFDDGEGDIYYDEEKIGKRGFPRIIFVGSYLMPLAFFFCLNKYRMLRQKIYLFLMTFFAPAIFLTLTRGMIIGSIVACLYYFVRRYRVFLLILLVAGILGYSSGLKLNEDSIFGKLYSETEKQAGETQQGNKDIRIQEYIYYFTNFSPNIITDIIGSGIPHSESAYGKYDYHLAHTYHLYLSDVGFAYIYVTMGGFGLLLFLLIFIKSFRVTIPPQFEYTKLFIIYVAINNISSAPLLSRDGVIGLCACLYILGNQEIREDNSAQLNAA